MKKLYKMMIISTFFLLPLTNVTAKEYNRLSVNEFIDSINKSTLFNYEVNQGTRSKAPTITSSASIDNNIFKYKVTYDEKEYLSLFKYDLKNNTLTYVRDDKKDDSDKSFEESIIDILAEATGEGTNEDIVKSLINFDYEKCDIENLGYCVQGKENESTIIIELSDKMATEVLKLKSKVNNKTADPRFQAYIDLVNNSKYIKSINDKFKENESMSVYGVTYGNEAFIQTNKGNDENLLLNITYNPELNTIKTIEKTEGINSFTNAGLMLILYFEEFSSYSLDEVVNSLANTTEGKVCDIENKGICVKYLDETETQASIELELSDKAINNYFSKKVNIEPTENKEESKEDEKSEEPINNPETGAFANFGLISLISIIAIIAIAFAVKKKKFYNI